MCRGETREHGIGVREQLGRALLPWTPLEYMYLKSDLPCRALGCARPILLHDQVVVGGIHLLHHRLLNCTEGTSVSWHWHRHDVELVVVHWLQSPGELRLLQFSARSLFQVASVFCKVFVSVPWSSAMSLSQVASVFCWVSTGILLWSIFVLCWAGCRISLSRYGIVCCSVSCWCWIFCGDSTLGQSIWTAVLPGRDVWSMISAILLGMCLQVVSWSALDSGWWCFCLAADVLISFWGGAVL